MLGPINGARDVLGCRHRLEIIVSSWSVYGNVDPRGARFSNPLEHISEAVGAAKSHHENGFIGARFGVGCGQLHADGVGIQLVFKDCDGRAGGRCKVTSWPMVGIMHR